MEGKDTIHSHNPLGKPDPCKVMSEQTCSLHVLNGIQEGAGEKIMWKNSWKQQDAFKTPEHAEQLPPHQEPLAMGLN